MRVLSCTVLLAMFTFGTAAAAQGTALDKVKELYAAAAYEDALAAVDAIQDQSLTREAEQYRAFCLIALGRTIDARGSIERIINSNPAFVPDATEASPRVQAMFAEARSRQLPGIIKRIYGEAKTAYERKNRSEALAGFTQVVQLVDSLPEPERVSLGDLRMVAAGFVELSSAPAPPPAIARQEAAVVNGAPAANSAVGTTGDGAVAESRGVPAAAATRGPVPVRQNIPVWRTTGAASTREYRGRIRVSITPEGTVSNVAIMQPTVPAYDQTLIQAARGWQYEPALRQGRPVASIKEVEVLLRAR